MEYFVRSHEKRSEAELQLRREQMEAQKESQNLLMRAMASAVGGGGGSSASSRLDDIKKAKEVLQEWVRDYGTEVALPKEVVDVLGEEQAQALVKLEMKKRE